ncbi:HAD family hydrolase [Blastococcus brunescens]|uniref:HAD family hydrolase n=1 Tax=Blastococcus brunescens TaxID=1564165 RepID=A0ABZ1B194_9ACTN|nr:HAD family hydrolase [Blastococcus sp. BMG 8361]WRL64514.1 HAD family hydrolase [Blastococcus sp. BMG 8361]
MTRTGVDGARGPPLSPGPLRVVPCDPRSGVLRPGQDGHRQVQHPGVRPAVLQRWADQPPRRAEDRLRAAGLLLAGADAQQMERLRAQLTAMVTGWDAATVHDIVRETLHEIVDPLVYAEAADLIEEHRAAGREIVIVSSSGAEMVEPIGEMLGVDQVVATRMVTEDGRYTGEISFYAYGENKAAAMREVAAAGGYDLADCYAYSDSITDLPMLSAVGHPTAVNPDRGLRKAALERGWPVLQFTRPVSMKARFSAPRRRWSPVRRWASARPSWGWPGTRGTGRCGPVCSPSTSPVR